jgi:hypothetical protein
VLTSFTVPAVLDATSVQVTDTEEDVSVGLLEGV